MPVVNTQINETTNITENGTYDVARYTTAVVNTPAPIIKYNVSSASVLLGDVDSNGVLQNANAPTDIVFTGVKGIAALSSTMGVLFRRFQNLNSIKSLSFPDLATCSTAYACAYMCHNCSNLESVDLSALTSAGERSFTYAFYGCTSLRSLSLPLLTSASSAAFVDVCAGCTSLESVNIPLLTNITLGAVAPFSNAFSDCTSLRSVNMPLMQQGKFDSMFKNCTSLPELILPSLTQAYSLSYMCNGCTSLTKFSAPLLTTVNGGAQVMSNMLSSTAVQVVKFESLNQISSGNLCLVQAFASCQYLTDVYFYALNTNSFGSYTLPFENMLKSDSNVTVHFPMRIQSKIGSWPDVLNGFGGTNTTVLFDIVTSMFGANSSSYSRQEKDSTDTATAWVNNGTLYYTSGTTEPIVGDTIYSDAECTTAVTTVSTIS